MAFTQRRARMHDAALYKNTINNNNSGPEYSIMGNGLFGNTFTAVATNSNAALSNGTPTGDSNGALNKNQGANGTEYFKLEAFGIAGLEVNTISAMIFVFVCWIVHAAPLLRRLLNNYFFCFVILYHIFSTIGAAE